MYRIELSPGEETAFRSIEELAVAIRRGVVTSHARIYHNATSRWLPIQFHPHYKLAVSMPLTQADLVAGPPVKPLSSLTLSEPGVAPAIPAKSPTPSTVRESAVQAALSAWPAAKPLSSLTPPRAPEPQPSIKIAEPKPATRRVAAKPAKRLPETTPARATLTSKPSSTAARVEQAPREKRSRKRRPQRALRLALAGALLIASTHLVVSPAGQVKLAVFPATASLGAELPLVSVPSASKILRSPRKAVWAKETEPTDSNSGASSAIEPPPSAIEMAVPTVASTESLAPKMVDSTGQKSLKRILRAINGSGTPERSRTRR